MSVNGETNPECPLCLEPLELDDINFFPCTCGYQICRFCWHRIRTNENGLCPACRKQYPEDPANFKPLTAEELQQIKNEKRQKDLQRKQKLSENRKHLANVRVVQKNLVFVVGLPQKLADPDELRKPLYFGKFGKIQKVIVNHSTSYAGSQGPSASAYVTYHRSEDALRAIQAVNNTKVDGKTLKASLGTTKYCSYFLKKMPCPKQDCMYLHELGDDSASFTKEEMQAGKHQEYEHKLYEQVIASGNQSSRKQLSPVDHTESLSPSSSSSSSFVQRDQWPSPPRKEDHKQNGSSENINYSQSSQNSLKSTYNSLSAFQNSVKNNHLRIPSEQISNRDFQRHFVTQSDSREEFSAKIQSALTNCANANSDIRASSVRELSAPCVVPHEKQNGYCINQSTSQSQIFENQSLRTHETQVHSSQSHQPQHIREQSTNFAGQTSQHSSQSKLSSLHPPGLPNGFSQYNNFVQMPTEMTETRSRVYPKYNLHNVSQNSSSRRFDFNRMHSEINCKKSVHEAENGEAVLFEECKPSNMHFFREKPSIPQSIASTAVENYLNNSFMGNEYHFDSQDDDLGFDPWHESAKGLADLMMKEDGERSRTNNFHQTYFSPVSSNKRIPLPAEQLTGSHISENVQQYPARQVIPPPGFSVNSYGANSSVPRPCFNSDTFRNKALPVMNSYNHTSATVPQFRGVHPQLNLRNNIIPEGGMRPQLHEWQENITNGIHNGLDQNFVSPSAQHISLPMNRFSYPVMNNSMTAEMQLLAHQRAMLNQSIAEGKVNTSILGKVFQQLKLAEQMQFQNHSKHNSYIFRGSST